jgi:putative oxidoreductase
MEKIKEFGIHLGLLWLRILMGTGIAYHGYQKIFSGMMERFTQGVAQMGFPAPEFFAWAAALSEFLGGIFIIAGFLTRPSAFFVFSTMTVAAFITHSADPLDVKELALAYWVIASTLILTGPGKFSIDRKIEKAVMGNGE